MSTSFFTSTAHGTPPHNPLPIRFLHMQGPFPRMACGNGSHETEDVQAVPDPGLLARRGESARAATAAIRGVRAAERCSVYHLSCMTVLMQHTFQVLDFHFAKRALHPRAMQRTPHHGPEVCTDIVTDRSL